MNGFGRFVIGLFVISLALFVALQLSYSVWVVLVGAAGAVAILRIGGSRQTITRREMMRELPLRRPSLYLDAPDLPPIRGYREMPAPYGYAAMRPPAPYGAMRPPNPYATMEGRGVYGAMRPAPDATREFAKFAAVQQHQNNEVLYRLADTVDTMAAAMMARAPHPEMPDPYVQRTVAPPARRPVAAGARSRTFAAPASQGRDADEVVDGEFYEMPPYTPPAPASNGGMTARERAQIDAFVRAGGYTQIYTTPENETSRFLVSPDPSEPSGFLMDVPPPGMTAQHLDYMMSIQPQDPRYRPAAR